MTSRTIKLPTNAAAEEVRRLREVNIDIEEQMRVLRQTQMTNSELIGLLSERATWDEIPDPAYTDPESAPEVPEEEPEASEPLEAPLPEPDPEPEPEPETPET